MFLLRKSFEKCAKRYTENSYIYTVPVHNKKSSQGTYLKEKPNDSTDPLKQALGDSKVKKNRVPFNKKKSLARQESRRVAIWLD